MSPGRPLGYGAVGGISTSDILQTAAVYGFGPDWFLRIVRVMDRAYLDAVNKQPAA